MGWALYLVRYCFLFMFASFSFTGVASQGRRVGNISFSISFLSFSFRNGLTGLGKVQGLRNKGSPPPPPPLCLFLFMGVGVWGQGLGGSYPRRRARSRGYYP